MWENDRPQEHFLAVSSEQRRLGDKGGDPGAVGWGRGASRLRRPPVNQRGCQRESCLLELAVLWDGWGHRGTAEGRRGCPTLGSQLPEPPQSPLSLGSGLFFFNHFGENQSRHFPRFPPPPPCPPPPCPPPPGESFTFFLCLQIHQYNLWYKVLWNLITARLGGLHQLTSSLIFCCIF